MNPVAHFIQAAIVGGTLLAICYFLLVLIRADLRANPARAKLPAPWAGTAETRAYIAALDRDDEDDGEPVETDHTPDPDHIRDLQIARELGVA
ncbi:hypothetical protein ACTWPB_07400 [Nocardia sp. IBHARD005]|uniref:hypothetical protein n=1 Tax=Nocardia sp. IBHARD005 TaxID=3457765 RepID=UPI0040594308